MNLRLSSVLSSDDLPLAELHAARLDGELVAVADYFSPIDEPDDVRHRSHLLAAMVPRRMIAEQHSAAWAWGVRDQPPLRHQFCVDAGARVCISSAAPHQLREVVIDDTEITSVGGLRLTTPLRTVIDIARASGVFEAGNREVLAALMKFGAIGEEECLLAMNRRRNLPRKNVALARIREAARRAN